MTAVSVVVNVFNGERFLAECLESVLNLRGAHELQVIVVDDASTDATATILDRYRRPPFEIVRLERNVGAAAAISHAFSFVRNEFVARIDYDDRYHPNFLIESLAALRHYPQAAFVCASAQMIDTDSIAGAVVGPSDYGEDPGCRDRYRSMLERHFVTAPTVLARTVHWRRAIPVPPGMNFCDWYMNLTMAETAPIAVIDRITADYRVHPLNMHATKIRDGMGERVTFEVLDRFLCKSVRWAELAPHARAIRASHYADWGDKYFGVGMNDHAARCYAEAWRADPMKAWKRQILRRQVGLVLGRNNYERGKSAVKRIARALHA